MLLIACGKRPLAGEVFKKIVNEVELEILNCFVKEVVFKKIAELTMKKLK